MSTKSEVFDLPVLETRAYVPLSVPLAILIAVASLGGILSPATYAKESASYAAQAIGQDWIDLWVLAPFLVATALRAKNGSRVAKLLLGGGLMYSFYNFAIYAFAVRFNALFLVYCATLGLSLFALASLAGELLRESDERWFDSNTPVKLAAGVQIGIAAVFAALWLSDVITAIAAGVPPKAVAENNFFTNPVHVLDLSFALPALVLSAVWLLKKRALGYLLTPMLLVLAVLMSVGIGAMIIAAKIAGAPIDLTIAAVFAVVAALCSTVLFRFLRSLRRPAACC